MFRNFTKYEVFDDGRVYSYVSKRFLKPRNDSTRGYYRIQLSDNNGNKKNYRLHRVVYEAVRGEIPEGLQVNHIDEDKSNNSISNLNLMTCKDNVNWGTGIQRRATSQRGKKRPNTSFKMKGKLINRKDQSKQVGKYSLAGVLLEVFPSTAEAQRNGFSSGHISACCRGKLPHYKGYQWIYFEGSPPLFI